MVTFERALVIALKIIVVNLIFVLPISLVIYVNLIVGLILALLLSPLMLALEIYFILEEAQTGTYEATSFEISRAQNVPSERACRNCALFETSECKRKEKNSNANPCPDYFGGIE